MNKLLKIAVGYDEREAVAYHVFCESLIKNSSKPLAFIPLSLGLLHDVYEEIHDDGSNSFIYSRFLIPWLCEFQGWTLYCDGDMVCQEDISKIFNYCDDSKAVVVVRHNYKTKYSEKYLGDQNSDYPRKNWSSVILWNNSHPANSVLTPEFVRLASGAYLHRFKWLDEDLIGDLPLGWNWLVREYESNLKAPLLHYTIGTPCFKGYRNLGEEKIWASYCMSLMRGYENE